VTTPALSPLSDFPSRAEVVAVPPPPWFKPIRGYVHRASLYGCAPAPPSLPAAQSSVAKRAGLRYERKVHSALMDLWPAYQIQASPTLKFVDDGGRRICIPDAVFIDVDSRTVGLFEIKAQHTPDAWWQLRQFYEPVVRVWLPECRVVVCEICRSYDPATPFNEPIILLNNRAEFKEFVLSGTDAFGVYRWR
jgi:hypothetical protein